MIPKRLRSLYLLLAPALLVVGCEPAPTRSDAGSARLAVSTATRHPILFVHGWQGDSTNWKTMIGRFKTDGWTDKELYNWKYNSDQSNATTAEQVRTKINEILAATGASKVDVITHSMGGLSTRYYAKKLGGDQKIDAWVSLGGPNHGTTTANACTTTSCVEMRIGSTFLTDLNSGDETPGTPRYGTWWSPCDEVIDPDDSVLLSGATNTRTTCITHNRLLEDAGVYKQVRDWVHR